MPDDAARKRSRWSSVVQLHSFSNYSLLPLTLALVSFLHIVSLWTFSRGFLLTRVALGNRTECHDCTLPARYKRLIMVVIDALRDDFLFPLDPTSSAFNSYYHNVLTTPARLSKEQPTKALSFRFVADPPTTTLQRLKGLTVGTLPTFIDAGSNFVGSEAQEDSWLLQGKRAGKRIAVMGDDTWLTVFPPSTGVFQPNLTFPYDSFNVEDLDTVDNGVRQHLYSLLKEARGQEWDISIAHLLGLDHVGHRVGPSHPEMTRKLREADDLVQHIVSRMKPEDLFILMGDHGMDSKGDHGGDSALEVNAALWMYSPSGLLQTPAPKSLKTLLDVPGARFEYNGKSERSVAQISLVPTLSLLLGLPIPFSNLGAVIPELLSHDLDRALRINADQVASFLRSYDSPGAGSDLKTIAPRLLSSYDASKTPAQYAAFLHQTLSESRSVWATFDLSRMLSAVALLAGSLAVTLKLYHLAGRDGALWRSGELRRAVGAGFIAGCQGLVLALACSVPFFGLSNDTVFLIMRVSAASAALGVMSTRGDTGKMVSTSIAFKWYAICMPLAHAAVFASNSLVVWEDRFVLGLLLSPLILLVISGVPVINRHYRNRMIGLGLGAIVCLRVASLVRVCREEQQGDSCTTNYYGHDHQWLIASFVCSLVLPTALRSFSAIAKAQFGLTALLIEGAMRVVLLCGTGYWWLESYDASALTKNALAWTGYAVALISALGLWRLQPLTHSVRRTPDGQLAIFGFANLFGASYLLFYCLLFSLVYVVTQPAGQVGLAFGVVGVLCAVEANDARRDAYGISPHTGPDWLELSMLSLWSHMLYFATGHQATLASIQWKAAFVGTAVVRYPVSPVLVVLNTFGPLCLLPALAVPLLVFWNVSPPAPRSKEPSSPMYRRLLRACLGLSSLFTILALSASVFVAYFRRHLMVWKIFAPRWMMASVALIGVDICLLLFAVVLGASVTLSNVATFVGATWA